jgi:cytochrome oxidase Cu insertion factor (SCO1/SenC/PrrC family)
MDKQSEKGAKSIKQISLWICVAFFVPLAFIWIYYADSSSQHQNFAQYGLFVEPPCLLSHLPVTLRDGTPAPKALFLHQWTLLLVNPGRCDVHCQQALSDMSQLRMAMGTQMGKIHRAVVTYPNTTKNEHLEKLIDTQYPGITLVVTTKPRLAHWLKGHMDLKTAMHQGALYVVDPEGSVMMFYHANSDPAHVFKDLQRIMTVHHTA